MLRKIQEVKIVEWALFNDDFPRGYLIKREIFPEPITVRAPIYPYVWFWKPSVMRPIDRKGQPCRVLVRGTMNSALIEFEDGFRVVASRNALRRRDTSRHR